MDTDSLVKARINDGRKFINVLSDRGFDVTAACWAETSEDGIWFLYVASQEVDRKKLAAAYREAFAILDTIPGTMLSASNVKLIGTNNPITLDILELRKLYSERLVGSPTAFELGSTGVNSIYVYEGPTLLRQSFSVRYYRQGQTNQWQARTEREKVYRDLRAQGAVAYSTARREGESPDDERFAIVSVLLELDPRFDEESIILNPDLEQLLANQARQVADERFRSHHPDAVVDHINDVTGWQTPATRSLV